MHPCRPVFAENAVLEWVGDEGIGARSKAGQDKPAR
jgi:hypothetical protein